MDDQKDILIMKARELKRLQIIRKVLDRHINQQEAAGVLNLSDRQIRRIVRRVRQEGDKGVIHRLRGKPSCHRLKEGFRQKVVSLYQKNYKGFGPLLASEKMLERNRISVCDETLRLWLMAEGLWQVKKQRGLKTRTWRARKEHTGEMIQMDGSHHDWLEDRGPKLVLMGYIDDATGHLYAQFYDYEGTKPAMESLRGYIQRYGVPTSLYLDKHSAYKNNPKYSYKDWPFRDKEELTQFARACRQLGIELIYAHSPQAKGRVERVFGTLQDRLVKEMRLEGIKTLKEANAFLKGYLPGFNRKFNVAAKESGDYHRPAQGVNLDEILSIQIKHALRNDRTVMHQNRLFQVLNRTRAKTVTVYKYLNGRMAIKSGPHRLEYRPIEARPRKIVIHQAKPRKRFVLPKDHIWRTGFRLKGSLKN